MAMVAFSSRPYWYVRGLFDTATLSELAKLLLKSLAVVPEFCTRECQFSTNPHTPAKIGGPAEVGAFRAFNKRKKRYVQQAAGCLPLYVERPKTAGRAVQPSLLGVFAITNLASPCSAVLFYF